MSALRGLANPTVEVNDRVIEIKPNSLKLKDGAGDITVRNQSAGGDAGTRIITEDAESKTGKVTFELITETTNIGLTQGWLRQSRQGAGNVIRITGEGGFSRAFRNMRITEEPEYDIGADGSYEVMFEGDVAA